MGAALQLFEHLSEHPVISMTVVKQLLKTAKPTAGKAIEVLQNAGILMQLGNRKRNRVYEYRKYLRYFDQT